MSFRDFLSKLGVGRRERDDSISTEMKDPRNYADEFVAGQAHGMYGGAMVPPPRDPVDQEAEEERRSR